MQWRDDQPARDPRMDELDRLCADELQVLSNPFDETPKRIVPDTALDPFVRKFRAGLREAPAAEPWMLRRRKYLQRAGRALDV